MSLGALALAVTAAFAGAAEVPVLTRAQADAILASARVVGVRDKPELILDIPLTADAPPGVLGIEMVYKGICGPDGAVATIDQLLDHAERDLARAVNPNLGRAQVIESMGESPTFNVQYEITDATFVAFFLPRVRQAAEIVSGQLDNRVNISVTMSLAALDPGILGSAGSRRYRLPWESYVEGLRAQSVREGGGIATDFPLNSVPANFSNGLANVTEVTVTEAQYRAIFGDTVRPQEFFNPAVNIRLATGFAWHFFDPCSIPPPNNVTSLTDVVVHEFIHPLGFVSNISGPNDGGFTSFVDNNPDNRLQGLDLARFRRQIFPGFPTILPPLTVAQFTTAARNGEGNAFFPNEHVYTNPRRGLSIPLESGDNQQPSHLGGGQGIMDPTIGSGETNCPFYLFNPDRDILDDLGWRPIFLNGAADCNGNGVQDNIDIANGTPDFDGDGIPDFPNSCEVFASGDINAPNAPQGVLRTIYEAPGFTGFGTFNPDTATVVRDELRSVFFSSLNLGSAAPRVVRYRAKFLVPAYDDTAFRVARPDDAVLRVNNSVLLNSTQGGAFGTDSAFVSTRPAEQSFIQLDSGWFDIELFTFQTGATITGDLIYQNRVNGDAWTTIPTANLRATLFEDCNNNGINDDNDPDALNDCRDCNNDGIPDANQNVFETVTGLGTFTTPTGTYDFEGSTDFANTTFDTEIALYNADTGALIANDDDGGTGTTSRLLVPLGPGNYALVVTGFNAVFSSDFGVTFPSCPAAGTYSARVGDVVVTGSVQSGFADRYDFSVAESDCDNDGVPDSQELDCDADGIPDDCQKPQLADFSDNDFDVIANENDTITFDTFGSDFDTEIAVYTRDGDFVTFNDDANGTFQSEISTTFAPGEYLLVLAGFDTAFFASDFLIIPNAGSPRSCSASGEIFVNFSVNGTSIGVNNGDFPSGRLVALPFAIEPASTGCNPADLAAPLGQLTFADISAFLVAFSTQDPAADLSAPIGQFTFADISAFLGAFSAGCP